MDQALLFEQTICAPERMLVLECPESVLEKRLLSRAIALKRFDDNAEAIQKRFNTFQQTTSEVIKYYAEMDKVMRIDASKPVEIVYADIEETLYRLLPMRRD
jgi:UMP-CMP kinase